MVSSILLIRWIVLLMNRLHVDSYLILEGVEDGALTRVAALVVVP